MEKLKVGDMIEYNGEKFEIERLKYTKNSVYFFNDTLRKGGHLPLEVKKPRKYTRKDGNKRNF